MAAKRQPRLPLSRDRILQAALAFADEQGIESLTMRRLAQELGFEAMSLYNHVANKDDMLDGILDLVLAESAPPAVAGDWDEAIRASAISVHEALTRHPWSCTLLMAPGHIRPARLRYMDVLLGRLREAGFSAEATYHAYHVLDGYIFGFSLWETTHTYTPEEEANMEAAFAGVVTLEEYPYLHEHGRQHFTDGPHREGSAFELGLDLIVAGLKQMPNGSARAEPS
jgi:AcrR family transcriptional regulator